VVFEKDLLTTDVQWIKHRRGSFRKGRSLDHNLAFCPGNNLGKPYLLIIVDHCEFLILLGSAEDRLKVYS